MDVLVVHPSLNERGGSEKVALTMIETFKEKGYTVALGTFEKTIWKETEKFHGNIYKPDIEFTQRRIFGRSAYGELLNFHFLFSKIPQKFKTTVISTTSPWFYCPPVEKIVVYFNCSPVKYNCGLRRAYLAPYNFIQNRFLKKTNAKYFLANSLFSSEIIKNVYFLETEVIYPPVYLETFHPSPTKKNLVVSVGRFDPSKNHETLVKAFKVIDKGECIIIGSARDAYSLKYVEKLNLLINSLKLNRKVKLIVNCSLEELQKILSKAKVYVHCAPYEYFGISIVEAMACGCVPIVHQSGGPYIDIITYDQYGFSFKSVNDLASKVRLLLDDNYLYRKFRQLAMERAKTFSKENFKSRILKFIR